MSIYEYDEELHMKTLHEEGVEEGELRLMISLICNKMKKGKESQTIANELEVDLALVEKIYNVAKNFAPDYNMEDILYELNEF